jgi:hypothetical protein
VDIVPGGRAAALGAIGIAIACAAVVFAAIVGIIKNRINFVCI